MKITRRNFVLSAAASVSIRPVRCHPSAHSLELAPRAFIIDGKSVFLISGCVDYFRCPAALWRDVLLRAKRAGLNTIAFYIAWNFHEPREGVFDFSGDRDLARFLDICGELGLSAFPRFGPFICDEWEAGGYPAWLMTKQGIELRTVNDVALPYITRWMEKVMPLIASRQVTRGGPVLLLQQENEYFFVGRPGVREYQDFLIRTMRELGIEVPIADCNGVNPATRRPGSLLTLNGGGTASVETLRRTQPGKPALISELYTDYIIMWGWPVSSYPTALMLEQQTFETLTAGGMWAYFMMYGGTNFGFWASTSWKSDQSFVTTSYYPRAPIHEGGAFNETYFASKAVNLLAANFQDLLTAGERSPAPVTFRGAVRAEALRTPRGYLLFVNPQFPTRFEAIYHTDGQSGSFIQTAEEWPQPELAAEHGVFEMDGKALALAETSSHPSMLPFRLQLDPSLRIDYANATLLGLAGSEDKRVLLFRGESGADGIVSLNGHRLEFVFGPEPVTVEFGCAVILGLSRRAADRAWFADSRVFIGPAYVGEKRGGQHECFIDAETRSLTTISSGGDIALEIVAPAASVEAHIALTNWKPYSLPEITETAAHWRDMQEPLTVEEFGAYQGYSWYRAEYHSARKRTAGLFFTRASDRIHVFVNGKRIGVWGRGPGAVRDPLPVPLEPRANRFVFLCDNMGRLSEGAVLDRKGIGGPAYIDAETRTLSPAVWSVPDRPPTGSWQYQTFHYYNPKATLRRAAYELISQAGEGLELSLRWFPQYAWIALDGKVIAEHAGDLSLAGGVDFSSVVLDPYLKPGRQHLEITLSGEPPSEFDSHLQLVAYPKSGELRGWGFRAWRDPSQAGAPAPGNPIWWQTEFSKPRVPGPFFIVTEGLSKGQAYLNGHALGRYWEIGPQYSLYAPDPWFAEQNHLTIFDEEGKSPERVYLARDEGVPLHRILL